MRRKMFLKKNARIFPQGSNVFVKKSKKYFPRQSSFSFSGGSLLKSNTCRGGNGH
jgi:hypothetical protein